MKNFIASLLTIIALNIPAFAQQITTNSALAPVKPHKSHYNNILMICYIDNGKDSIITSTLSLKLIEQKSIKQMEITEGEKAVKHYGTKAFDGVVLLTLVKDSTLISNSRLLDKFKIAKANQKLPLYVDGIVVAKSNELYYSPSTIKSVTIEEKADNISKFINVQTTSRYANIR